MSYYYNLKSDIENMNNDDPEYISIKNAIFLTDSHTKLTIDYNEKI